MLTPAGRGPFAEQAGELMASLREILGAQAFPMVTTAQTVFLRDSGDEAECRSIFTSEYGANLPVTQYVAQPPCCGAALALEAWAIGGPQVHVERFGPHAMAVSYDGLRWTFCGGLAPAPGSAGAHSQMLSTLGNMRAALRLAGSGFEQVVRTWFCLGGITKLESGTQRYLEMNRARADFYRNLRFRGLPEHARPLHEFYPASTGIGMNGAGLVASCVALQTHRKDALLAPLENPQQTPAYAYHSKYSPQSPRFSRGVALQTGKYLTSWISGTASIVNSESRYPGDIQKQTEQTIENIERLLSPEAFLAQGIKGAGVRLQDLAKIRVYLKRSEDSSQCKAICERRFGPVPAIYALADVCRPELLVEIEGVAFTRLD